VIHVRGGDVIGPKLGYSEIADSVLVSYSVLHDSVTGFGSAWRLSVRDLATGTTLHAVDAPVSPKAFTVAPDGSSAMLLAADGVLTWVDLATGESRALGTAYGDQPVLAACATGVVFAGTGGYVMRWSWRGDELPLIGIERTVPDAEFFAITGLAVAPDGRHLVVSDDGDSEDSGMVTSTLSDGSTRRIDLATGATEQRIKGDEHVRYMSGDGMLVVGRDRILRTSDLSTVGPAPRFDDVAPIRGSSVVVARDEERVVLHDLATGTELTELTTPEPPHHLGRCGLRLAPNGRTLVTSGSDVLRRWVLDHS
jgi:hypothetical protein